jgi:hypothetical protein
MKTSASKGRIGVSAKRCGRDGVGEAAGRRVAGREVAVGVGVSVGPSVGVGVSVGRGVAVGVNVGVGVAVGSSVRVGVGVTEGVCVGVGIGEGARAVTVE